MLNTYNKLVNSWLPKPDPVLDEESIDWLLDVYDWSREQFFNSNTVENSQLILPNNTFFPGRETNLDGMAQLIFDQVKNYTNLQGWTFEIVPQQLFEPLSGDITIDAQQVLPIPYDPQMVANPEALIGSYVHSISQYLSLSAKQEPPGGIENLAMATEVLAVFFGFGVILANTGFTHSGGCGSCSATLSTRQSALSQFDVTYALAIYCTARNIPASKATGNLKSSLRSYYKKCLQDVQKHQSRLIAI